jgi:hypothetical protein
MLAGEGIGAIVINTAPIITNGSATTNNIGRSIQNDRTIAPQAIIIPRHISHVIENSNNIAISGRTNIWQGM